MRCGTRATRLTTSACSGRTPGMSAGGTRRPTAGSWHTGPRWATSGKQRGHGGRWGGGYTDHGVGWGPVPVGPHQWGGCRSLVRNQPWSEPALLKIISMSKGPALRNLRKGRRMSMRRRCTSCDHPSEGMPAIVGDPAL